MKQMHVVLPLIHLKSSSKSIPDHVISTFSNFAFDALLNGSKYCFCSSSNQIKLDQNWNSTSLSTGVFNTAKCAFDPPGLVRTGLR